MNEHGQTVQTGLDEKTLAKLDKELLEKWLLPEANRRGFSFVWLRIPGEERAYALPHATSPDVPRNPEIIVTLKVAEPNWEQQPNKGAAVTASQIDWESFEKEHPDHLLLDAAEFRLGISDIPPMFFNDKVDQDVFMWAEQTEAWRREEEREHPGGRVTGSGVTLPDGTTLDNLPPAMEEATQSARANYAKPYGLIVWDLAHERLYTNVPEGMITGTATIAPGRALAGPMPQQTFEEVRALGLAMADTPRMRYWELAPDNESYLYKRPGERLEVKFDPSTLPDLWSGKRPDTPAAMESILQERGWKGLLTLQLAMNCAVMKPDEPLAIDEFVKHLFDVRSAKQRNEKRIWVWETLCAIFNMRLYGLRAGTYKDPQTKKVLELTFRGEPLIAPSPGTRTYANGQQSLWPDDVPVTIGFTMGKWGVETRKNPKALQYFGELKEILDIPSGKPSGAWAQCILFNLRQLWRQHSKAITLTTRDRIDPAGNDRKVTTIHWPHPFTRRALLVDLFPPEEAFSVLDILQSDRPGRAVTYWNEAINILKAKGHVSTYRQIEKLDTKRKGWADEWLDQPLDIQPGEEGRKDAIEIMAAHRKTQTALKRKRKPPVS